jgi:hypothetical protein
MTEQIRVAIHVHIITGAYSYHALAAAAFWALYCNSNVAASTFFSISMTASGGQKPSAWTTSRKSDHIHGKISDIKTIQVKPLATVFSISQYKLYPFWQLKTIQYNLTATLHTGVINFMDMANFLWPWSCLWTTRARVMLCMKNLGWLSGTWSFTAP